MGRWADTPVRPAYDTLRRARRAHDDNVHWADNPHQGILGRRRNHQAVEASASSLGVAEAAWEQVVEPHAECLTVRQTEVAGRGEQLHAARQARIEFLATNPGVISDIHKLNKALAAHDARERHERRTGQALRHTPERPAPRPSAIAHLDHSDPRPAHPLGPQI